MKRAATTLGFLAGILTIVVFALGGVGIWTSDSRYGWLAGLAALAAIIVGVVAIVLASQADIRRQQRQQQDGRPW